MVPTVANRPTVSDAEVLRIMTAVKHRIMQHPETYRQDKYRRTIEGEFRSCDTACCIAGHVDIKVNGMDAFMARPTSAIKFAAAKALGNRPLLGALFWSYLLAYNDELGYWPNSLRPYLNNAPNPSAEDACRAIDWWLQENGIDPNGAGAAIPE